MRWFLLLALMTPTQPPAREKPEAATLLEDADAGFFAKLNNDGSLDASGVGYEFRDCYSGSVSVRATPHQRFSSRIPGWSHEIVEKPNPGQYRYVRFAWKRIGGDGIMIQFHNTNGIWNQRYLAGRQGPSTVGWGPMLSVSNQLPTEWTVVTRDFFRDFGAMTITGMALTPMEGGTAGLFDHMYFGRTIEDLDLATRRQFAPDPKEIGWKAELLETAWEDLGSLNVETSGAAIRTMLAGREATAPFLKKKLEVRADPSEEAKRVRALIADLQSPSFRKRELATAELERLGPSIAPILRASMEVGVLAETRRRLEGVLRKFPEDGQAALPPEKLRKIRSARVLEWSANEPARALLAHLSQQTADPELAAEAKESLRRASKK